MDYKKVIEETISHLNNIKRSILYLNKDSSIGYFKGEYLQFENSEHREKHLRFELVYYLNNYDSEKHVVYKASYKLPDNWVFDDEQGMELNSEDLENQFYQRVWFELNRFFVMGESRPNLEDLDGIPAPIFAVKDLLYHRPEEDLITVVREKQLQS